MIEFPPVIPLFDTLSYVEDGNPFVNQYLAELSTGPVDDATLVYEHAVDWLLEQRHSENNYKSYRSELTSFLHWVFDVEKVSLAEVDRKRLSRYIDYCCAPPTELIGYHNVAQFLTDRALGVRYPNPAWRPFLGKREDGKALPYRISDRALKTRLAILSSFFTYLIHEEYTERNPALILLNNGRFREVNQSQASGEDNEDIRALSELQWSYVIETAEQLATEQPERHERTLFLVSLLYSCYLRISEVAARPGFSPVMSQFRRDNQSGTWSFLVPRSKGGKRRSVAVSDALLERLKHYRKTLGLSAMPVPGEQTPLFIRQRAAGRGRDLGMVNANLGIRQLRDEIMFLYAKAAERAAEDGLEQDSREIREMTPHSLRHTGISHDINLNGRPLAHVQADAGHDSLETTSGYLHTRRIERHESAAGKPIDRLEISYRSEKSDS